jgi:hypothetical protein
VLCDKKLLGVGGGGPLDNLKAPIIISKVTSRSNNMDPLYWLLSEERNESEVTQKFC